MDNDLVLALMDTIQLLTPRPRKEPLNKYEERAIKRANRAISAYYKHIKKGGLNG